MTSGSPSIIVMAHHQTSLPSTSSCERRSTTATPQALRDVRSFDASSPESCPLHVEGISMRGLPANNNKNNDNHHHDTLSSMTRSSYRHASESPSTTSSIVRRTSSASTTSSRRSSSGVIMTETSSSEGSPMLSRKSLLQQQTHHNQPGLSTPSLPTTQHNPGPSSLLSSSTTTSSSTNLDTMINVTNSTCTIARVKAQVMTRDESTGGWLPVSGGGLSNVRLIKRSLIDRTCSTSSDEVNSSHSSDRLASKDKQCFATNSSNQSISTVNVSSSEETSSSQDHHASLPHEYLIVGTRISDENVVLYCNMKRDFVYNEAIPTFHHWKTGNTKFGLTFVSASEAKAFDHSVTTAINDLLLSHDMGKDKWMDVGCQDDELKHYIEPETLNIALTREEIEESLKTKKNYLFLNPNSSIEQNDSRSSSSFSLKGSRPALEAVTNNGHFSAHNVVQRSVSATSNPRRFSRDNCSPSMIPTTTPTTNTVASVRRAPLFNDHRIKEGNKVLNRQPNSLDGKIYSVGRLNNAKSQERRSCCRFNCFSFLFSLAQDKLIGNLRTNKTSSGPSPISIKNTFMLNDGSLSKPSTAALSPLASASANRVFPRGSPNGNTFYSDQTRERRQPFNGGAPSQAQDTTSVSSQSGRPSFFNKLSIKFCKR